MNDIDRITIAFERLGSVARQANANFVNFGKSVARASQKKNKPKWWRRFTN